MVGFDGAKYAVYNIYSQAIGVVGLLVLMPIAGGHLGWHETTQSLFINVMAMGGLVGTAFVVTLTGRE